MIWSHEAAERAAFYDKSEKYPQATERENVIFIYEREVLLEERGELRGFVAGRGEVRFLFRISSRAHAEAICSHVSTCGFLDE